MGLHTQLNDVSSNSLPFLILALIATFVTHLRSLLPSSTTDAATSSPLFTTKDHENNNYNEHHDDVEEIHNCIFCLNGLRQGDCIRKLTCRHVFHTHCLDGWIELMKFSCPLCRSPFTTDWRVDRLHRRVSTRLSAWFAVR